MLSIFESRNRKISDIIKLGDYLGYSLRENIQLFSIDGVNNKVTYLTEDNYIVEGTYSINKGLYLLENINIQEATVFTDNEKFDLGIKNQVSLFLEGLYNDEYRDAESSFSDVIDIFTSRAHYQNAFNKLQKKASIFNQTNTILEGDEYARFLEVVPDLVTFLSENKDAILKQVPEVVNSLKLSESVSEAFNIPQLTIEEVRDAGRFEFSDNSKKSIYEMICKQELVKKEILEAKNSFDLVWATEPVIDALAGKVFASDEEVEGALTEALKELPYLALVSKKKLLETLSRNLGDSSDVISEKDMRTYVGRLFEMKKPAKHQLTQLLSEKYGVNLQYLKESYSFKSLINTQVVLFESISKIAPKNSVLKQVISEFSTYLKGKNGVQGVDMNNIIQQVFQHAGFSNENVPLMESFSFTDIKKTFEKAEALVEAGKKKTGASKGDKGKDKKDHDAKDYEDGGDRKGDESETKPGEKDYEKEEEEDDKKKDKKASGDVQKEEVDKDYNTMSDEEIMKAIKSLSDAITGDDIEDEEDL